VFSRIVELRERTSYGVESSNIGSLVAITEKTCEREVAIGCWAKMLDRDDVVDPETKARSGLGDAAVFAPFPGAGTYQSIQGF
jgi:hypothetical protein